MKNNSRPDYIFRNGDTVCVGFKTYQVLNGEMIRVMDFIPVDGQEHHYIKPGELFTYQVRSDDK